MYDTNELLVKHRIKREDEAVGRGLLKQVLDQGPLPASVGCWKTDDGGLSGRLARGERKRVECGSSLPVRHDVCSNAIYEEEREVGSL